MFILRGYYDGWIVTLSFLIALFVAYSALNLTFKITSTSGKSRLGWLIAASFVMGSGIWAMHFVGMLAFHLELPVHYDVRETSISVFASIIGSFAAFYLTMTRQATKRRLALGSLIMGAGIVAMHFIGMSAMRAPATTITYKPLIWAVAALFAVVASYAALYIFTKFRRDTNRGWPKWGASALMGLAVCGMHYTGMSAAEFWCGDDELLMRVSKVGVDLVLLISITLVMLMIMMVTWIALYVDRTLLERMAFSDPLTGLHNRHAMNHHFDQKLGDSSQSAVLFLDLDQFKLINDTLGHDIGDLLIQEVASRLQKFLGQDRYVFRLGGDEFLLLVNEMKQEAIETMALLILEEIRKVYVLEGNELYITGSIGISFAPQHGKDRSTLLKAADTAMYQAKRLGKNQFCSFNIDLEQKLIRRMEIEKGLRSALASEQLALHYQPKWNSERNCPVGFEALLRWNHPKYGLIAPNEFIPIAEETGLIVGMTRWVLERACIDCKEWNMRTDNKLGVSVNLSINVFESKNLMDMITAALQRATLAPEMLELEITESIVMKDAPDVIRQLLPLQEMGVTISMDNFGSGYSFLGAIDQIPFHTLKIDKHYMQESDSPSKRAIVNTIITLANQLNLELVAEGVETEQQLDFLRAAGCTVMQGYYFKRPMPREELDRWLFSLKQEAV